MSLFLGNLSPHIRREELERVFRRFGRCNVQLKAGFGFVIYELPANADRALRTLRGKVICGRHISLSWSNKQPKPFQRFARSARFCQPYHRRNFTREEVQKSSSQDQGDISTYNKHSDRRDVGPSRGDPLDKETVYGSVDAEDHIVEKAQILQDGVLDGTMEPNPVENDRWGERASDTLNYHAVENGSEFDRYEPCDGSDRRDGNDHHHVTTSYGSPVPASSLERERGGQSDDAGNATDKQVDNQKQTCYICGLMGHVMCNCPRREKFSRFHRKQAAESDLRGRDEGRFSRQRIVSHGRPYACRDHLLLKQNLIDRKASGSERPRRVAKRSESILDGKENHHYRRRRDPHGKRRGEHAATIKQPRKKNKKYGSLPVDSASNESNSHSHSISLKSSSEIRSCSDPCSRPLSSRSHSDFSWSAASCSRIRSRSRSKSGSLRALSLSISLNKKSPSSLNKAQKNGSGSPKAPLERVIGPKSEQLLPGQCHLEGNVSPENLEMDGTKPMQKDANALSSTGTVNEMNMEDDPRDGDDGENHLMSMIRYEEKNLCMIPKGENVCYSENMENSRGRCDTKISKPVELDPGATGSMNQNIQAPVSHQAANFKGMLSEEVCTVLRQYGMDLPEENGMELSVDSFFGAARMWPWEVIYYRRLKKGLISVENYARRVAQNSEFGIVDKYIRSSSGWGECNWNDP